MPLSKVQSGGIDSFCLLVVFGFCCSQNLQKFQFRNHNISSIAYSSGTTDLQVNSKR